MSNKIGKIYKITNTLNNKIYIGKTVQQLTSRKAGHHRDSKNINIKTVLYNSIRKYKWENFTMSLVEDKIDIKDLSKRETYWILKLNSLKPNGMNIKVADRNVWVKDIDSILKEYDNGMTRDKIVKKYHMDHRVLKSVLLENGRKVLTMQEINMKQSNKNINKKILEKLYIEEQMGASLIAEIFGLSKPAIRNWLNKFEIKTSDRKYCSIKKMEDRRKLVEKYKYLRC